jgi:hypothetical protein
MVKFAIAALLGALGLFFWHQSYSILCAKFEDRCHGDEHFVMAQKVAFDPVAWRTTRRHISNNVSMTVIESV